MTSAPIALNNAVLDELIATLLTATPAQLTSTIGSQAISDATFVAVLAAAQATFLMEPMLPRVEPPVMVFGSIHANIFNARGALRICGVTASMFRRGATPAQLPCKLLFLGNYCERGRHGIPVVMLMFCLKLRFATQVTLLRGKHECASINRIYGFYDEVKRHFSIKTWKKSALAFDSLPLAAIIGERVFCCSGGLTPDCGIEPQSAHVTLEKEIEKILRPISVPDHGFVCDLLWARFDKDAESWSEGNGVSYDFGPTVLNSFLQRTGFSMLVTGSMLVASGVEFACGRRLIQVFSANNHCDECHNVGAALQIDKDLMVRSQTFAKVDE